MLLAVAFESDSHLFGGAKRLEDLHGLGRISQGLAINILDQVTRAQTECRELLPVSCPDTPGNRFAGHRLHTALAE